MMSILHFRNARIVIVGGCGFIGRHLVKRVLELGANVWIINRGVCHRMNFPGLPSNRLRILKFSVSNEIKLQQLFLKIKPHFIFNLAAMLNRDKDLSIFHELLDTHVIGVKNIINAILKSSFPSRLIQIGTVNESAGEKLPSPYVLTKFYATKLTKYACEEFGLDAIIVRFPLVYGPGQRNGMLVPDLITSCLNKKDFWMTSGKQSRDFIFVEDAVEGMIKASQKPELKGEILHLGSGEPVAVRKVATIINKLLGNPIKIFFGQISTRSAEDKKYVNSIKKAQKTLSWSPKISLIVGLKKTIEWHTV